MIRALTSRFVLPAALLAGLAAPVAAADYYAAARPGTGAGTAASPFGLDDLPAAGKPGSGKALAVLAPGDTLYLRGGDYALRGLADRSQYNRAILCPARSGESGRAIVIAAHPGETVRVWDAGGNNPPLGTLGPDGRSRHHVRFVGLTTLATSNLPGVWLVGSEGVSVEYCRVVGKYVPTMDNHDGIRADRCKWPRIIGCHVSGVLGDGPNSALVKLYLNEDATIEGCLLETSNTGVFDKTGNRGTVVKDCAILKTAQPYRGNDNGNPAVKGSATIEGCILEGRPLYAAGVCDLTIRENHLFSAGIVQVGGIWRGKLTVEGNTVFSPVADFLPVEVKTVAWAPPGNPSSPIAGMDNNLYLARTGPPAPVYAFGQHAGAYRRLTLAEVQASGVERHSLRVGPTLSFPDPAVMAAMEAYGPPARPKTIPAEVP